MDDSNLDFKSANNTLNESKINLPPKLNSSTFGIKTDESDTIALQQFAYRAKFAEQISQEMRMPSQITFEDDFANRNTNNRGFYSTRNDILDESGDHGDSGQQSQGFESEMRVPRKITLDPNDNARQSVSSLSPINEINLLSEEGAAKNDIHAVKDFF